MKKYNLKKYRSIFSFIIILLFFITILSTACATDPDKRMDPGGGSILRYMKRQIKYTID